MYFLFITFNTGDNYYYNTSPWLRALIIQIIGSFLAFLGAYIIFRLGTRRDRRRDELKEEGRLKNILGFTKVSLQTNLEPIRAQIKSLGELIEQLKAESVIDLKLTLNTSLDFTEWMKSIDFIDLQKAFFLYYPVRNPYEEYGNLIKHLLHLRNITDRIADDFFEIIRDSNRFEGMFNDGKTILFEKLEHVRNTLKNAQHQHLQDEEVQIAKAVDEFFGEKNEEKRNDMFFTYKKMILPLGEVVKVSRDPDLLKCIRECGFAFASYQKVQKINQNRFSVYRESLKNAVNFFPDIIAKLDSIPSVYK